MINRIETAEVKLWDMTVGAVSWIADRQYAVFEYSNNFLRKNLDIAPITMGLAQAQTGDPIFSFPTLNNDTFWGLPGLLADSLPDKFGNRVIDAWLARNGRTLGSFSPVERLCYVGKRGMGALEFYPSTVNKYNSPVKVEIKELVNLAQEIMQERKHLNVEFSHDQQKNGDAIVDILRVGVSAGGARPKAIIAINNQGQVLSGQADVPKGYTYWLLKFDGVSDLELGETKGFGRIEYAYYLMAKQAGIKMTQCKLLEENGRAHFMTKRFDRVRNTKIHCQTLCGIAHYDYNLAGAYSYEQAFAVMRQLRCHYKELEQQYRRMVFNVIARNQDDHTKNISFMMNQDGIWKLTPAYDMTYSHNPHGQWTNQHQMSINGKRDHFRLEDLLKVANSIGINKAESIIQEVASAISVWPDFADEAGVQKKYINEIKKHHRMNAVK